MAIAQIQPGGDDPLPEVIAGVVAAFIGPGSSGICSSAAADEATNIHTVMIELAFKPAIHSAGEDLISDVIFTDNYGDEHRLPSVRFRRRGPLTTPLSTVTA